MDIKLKYSSDELTEENLVELWHKTGWNGASDKYPARLLSAMQNSAYVVTAWDGSEMVGLCACMTNGMQVYVSQLAVVKSHQKQGIGSILIQDVVTHYDTHEIVLVTEKARGFYEKNGFECNGYNAMHIDNRDNVKGHM